jgi:hypothetical protein
LNHGQEVQECDAIRFNSIPTAGYKKIIINFKF